MFMMSLVNPFCMIFFKLRTNISCRIGVECVFFVATELMDLPGTLDFGSVSFVAQDFNPPEVLNGHSSSEKHDIWSLGLCILARLKSTSPQGSEAEIERTICPGS